MSDDYQKLVDMFEGKGHGPGWLPEGRPWWPPLDCVWHNEGVCPQRFDGSAGTDPKHWAEAWALLQKLHAEFQEAKSRRSGG